VIILKIAQVIVLTLSLFHGTGVEVYYHYMNCYLERNISRDFVYAQTMLSILGRTCNGQAY